MLERKKYYKKKRGLSTDSKVLKNMKRDFQSTVALTKMENDKKIDKLVGKLRHIHEEALPTKLKGN